jgi:hypothetical protein
VGGAPALASGKDKERDMLFTVVAVTILSTIAITIVGEAYTPYD